MHDIWNPWHGCRKYSEGCQNCYMYYLDAMRGKHGSDIYKVKTKFNYPIQKERDVIFFLLTKRADRIMECLPDDWEDGYEASRAWASATTGPPAR